MVRFEVEFWVGFGLMLGHLEAMLGLCWAILGLCWALLAAFGLKFQPQRKHGSVEVEFWVGFGLKIGSKRVAPSTFSF